MGDYWWLIIVAAVVGIALGGAVAIQVWRMVVGRRIRTTQGEVEALQTEAQTKYKEMLFEAKEEGLKIKTQAESEIRERRAELQRHEKRISQKEENLDKKMDTLEKREQGIIAKEKEAEGLNTQLQELKQKQVQRLELISGISSAEAKDLLIKAVEDEVREDVSRRLYELEAEYKQVANEKAQEILSQAMQRCATDVVSESTVSVVPLPSDEMKGRLIGREGRNIRALENATGVDLIIDDTPEAVTISGFDPVRREIARIALEKLILDGRIHPARIEEMVATAKSEVDAKMHAEGENAVREVGIPGLQPELVKLLGRLKYRFSYGQNVLQHSIEVAHLAGMIASELGVKVALAKRAGLLHDIGKAVDFQVEGPHAKIGYDIVRQWDKSAEVANAVAEHHGETDSTSILGFIISAADALSGGRPGARRESLERYLQRLEALENVANSFSGVEKSYAIQAGREIRIMVKPVEIDDIGALRLTRDIVKKIEETLEYPGQIKVTVIRETRSVEYAK
ncbi:MAG: ribonuclease Y [Dehalococcoidia bacterium]|jgi:ribonuclease Y|nr:ribonuclease Y [Dehalococcoidia bacterium]